MANSKNFLREWFPIPNWCVLCDRFVKNPSVANLCQECLQAFPVWNEKQCTICGGMHQICPNNRMIALRWLHCCFYYQDSIRKLLTGFKYHKDFIRGKVLAKGAVLLLKDRLPDIDFFDCVLPIPSTPRKVLWRGYNSAAWLAKEIFPEKVEVRVSKKILDIPNLASLKREERFRQMKSTVFQVSDSIAGKKVLIFDDVMTTGITLRSFIQEVSKQKPASISAFVLAGNIAPG